MLRCRENQLKIKRKWNSTFSWIKYLGGRVRETKLIKLVVRNNKKNKLHLCSPLEIPFLPCPIPHISVTLTKILLEVAIIDPIVMSITSCVRMLGVFMTLICTSRGFHAFVKSSRSIAWCEVNQTMGKSVTTGSLFYIVWIV